MPRLATLKGANLSATSKGPASAAASLTYVGKVSISGTYTSRNVAVSQFAGATRFAVYEKPNDEVILVDGNTLSQTRIQRSATGKEDQGWYQCAFGEDTIWIGKPFTSTNAGSVEYITLDANNTVINTGSFNAGGTNFFGYKLHLANSQGLAQRGYVGDLVRGSNDSGSSAINFAQSSITRGIRAFYDAVDQLYYIVYGTVSGNSASMQFYHCGTSLQTNTDNYINTVSGTGAEVARHSRLARSSTGELYAYFSGNNSGTQLRKKTTGRFVNVSCDINDDTDGVIAAWGDYVAVNSTLYLRNNTDNSHAAVVDLVALSGESWTPRGVADMNDTILVVPSQSAIYVYKFV